MRFTPEQYAEYLEKRARMGVKSNNSDLPIPEADPGPENGLQSKIERYCREHGFPYWHDRSRGCNEAGFPDCVICLPAGRVLFLEFKSRTGRLTTDQQKWKLMLERLSHDWHEVRSYRRFLEIVNAE